MTDQQWGHCQHCNHFGSPARAPVASEEAPCNEPRLAAHRLTVFGACGCTLFELRVGLDRRVEQPALVPA